MGRVAPFILLGALQLWVIVESMVTEQPRLMPRWSWVLLNLFVPVFSAVLWFTSGRPRKFRGRDRGPDDDPDFLRSL